MSRELFGLADSPEASQTPPLPPQMDSEPQHVKTSIREASAAFPMTASAPHRLKGSTAERGRRHSADGVTTDEATEHYHPYRRQYSDGGRPCLPPPYPVPRPSLHPYPPVCFQGMDLPQSLSTTHNCPDQGGQQGAWGSYRESLRPSTGRFTAGSFSAVGQLDYSLQCLPPQSPQDNIRIHTFYPKPIYSYSILIFMALRSSRTGSLPVSEIYSFMTEHFPYFKTAPDGWKNSVRHNLSLNKCFEKVENRSGGGREGGAGGGASRKGCLWALNPARVEKMQEELRKWRRKDPLTVHKSMARPEELEHLLGENTDGLRPVTSHFTCHTHLQGPTHLTPPVQAHPPRSRPGFDPPPSFSHSQPGTPGYAFGHSLQSPGPPPFPYPCSGILREVGSLETPPCSSAPQAERCGHRTTQGLLIDGEPCSDIDALNPTLTDLQLHGNLWEELRDDSLALDLLQLVPRAGSPAPPSHAGTFSPCCQ